MKENMTKWRKHLAAHQRHNGKITMKEIEENKTAAIAGMASKHINGKAISGMKKAKRRKFEINETGSVWHGENDKRKRKVTAVIGWRRNNQA